MDVPISRDGICDLSFFVQACPLAGNRTLSPLPGALSALHGFPFVSLEAFCEKLLGRSCWHGLYGQVACRIADFLERTFEREWHGGIGGPVQAHDPRDGIRSDQKAANFISRYMDACRQRVREFPMVPTTGDESGVGHCHRKVGFLAMEDNTCVAMPPQAPRLIGIGGLIF